MTAPDPVTRRVPDGHEVARTTPTWTRATVPAALLADHHTTVWAELVVEVGEVRFYEVDGPDAPWETIATPDAGVVIVANLKHRIEPSADARFHVVFYAEPSPG